ncbi:hypothetical protein BU24DRAFT_451960 [Aaosphaeria arxii CBS 175.79]|uniref:Large ribosomal subunit protein mL67 n=1 Tax=Aaosphaeria arxii CBS 175.79 TaxID=1450172 RepID=A0A6A5XQ89_9PLEO|nr:uncharacterized protein BU24DRAFT_451960 [Aaosphaeria arxii CBS 175.79]KAF2015066.1 hypothetical protein BU24DRAFT_451960 [Aaosphaeria arxii CBS 175.79]
MPRRLPPPSGHKVWTDLLPSEGLRDHGRHIYMFRHVRTNQVVYSLHPRVIQRTLDQLPFIGKHSKPPSVRPDHWTALCRVGPFPTSRQGIGALKKLREFRKVHELSWDKTNPEWKRSTKKGLITKIMDQRANSVADLAKVLSMQEIQAESMEEKTANRKTLQEAYLKKKWAELEALAASIETGAVKELEKKIRDCKSVLGEKKVDAQEAARLNKAMAEHRHKLKEILWAQHIIRQLEETEKTLDASHETRIKHIKSRIESLRSQGRNDEADAIKLPERPENTVRTQFLPKALKSLPTPFTLNGVEIHWADLQDAERASEWPEAVLHDTLAAIVKKRKDGFVTVEEAKDQLREIEEERIRAAKKLLGIAAPEVDEAPKEAAKTGVWKYIPEIKNPFKRATA